ncbi:OmpA family protein [Bradyrhizobium sp. LHD-71]|uniref:OmpA family protein n=1 Tax=Bradyrhizobium sp. LHD-71 TaxID=3072141 RepID=UPI00280DC416|nr:OmpA family protein [Bradyrhizobium sp. LHD-71]MDQ8730303.1 OmpA family protein [Bradyrhizobium sp. LHD-71]
MRTLLRVVRKWWPGLIPLAILWGLAAWFSTVPFEANLAGRTALSLRETILDKTRIEAAGRDLTVGADAFSEDGRRSSIAIAEAVPGVRLVHDQTRIVDEAKPFTWAAERNVSRLTLSGNVPLPAVRARLLEASRGIAGGIEVADQMAFARGVPPRFEATALLLLEQLGRLRDGKVALSDTSVRLSGIARELGGREAIAAALRNLPEGYAVAENAVAAPPYIFQVNKDPVAATLTLGGYVPDNAAHVALIEAAKRKFLNEKIVDNLKASVGAPAGFVDAATAALGALSRLSTGSLTMSDRKVKLSGDALYDVAADEIRTGLPGELPKGWHAEAEVSTRPPASAVDGTVCEQLFTELLGHGHIRFVSGQADIDNDSRGLMDRLVEIALRCPTSNLEIVGHTDSDGDEATNMRLSERRAQAVLDYMLRAGLPADRLHAVGYGQTQPVASNDTAEGKAQNRRIEFRVR